MATAKDLRPIWSTKANSRSTVQLHLKTKLLRPSETNVRKRNNLDTTLWDRKELDKDEGTPVWNYSNLRISLLLPQKELT